MNYPSVIMRLKRHHLQRHHAFLKIVLACSTVRQVRRIIINAKYLQLLTLIKSISSVALKQVPATDQTARAYWRSKKKRVLKQHFGSWSSVKKLVALKDMHEWRRVLLELAPLIKPTLATFFNQDSEDK